MLHTLTSRICETSQHHITFLSFITHQGEDGNTFDALSTVDSHANNSWSYKSALNLLSKNDNSGLGAQVERTSVASIIAAARSNLRRGEDVPKEEDALGGSGQEEGDGSDGSSGSDSEDGDESDGSSSSDDEVDDQRVAHSMESDVLKVRERPEMSKKKKAKEAAAPPKDEKGSSSESNEDDASSSEGGSESGSESDNSDVEQENEDEDEIKEAAKAAAFFDSSQVTTTRESEGIDSFSQLGLSRPLLRGVASMGFVTPTPIQSSVLPVALAGRDVCASAVTGSEFIHT